MPKDEEKEAPTMPKCPQCGISVMVIERVPGQFTCKYCNRIFSLAPKGAK